MTEHLQLIERHLLHLDKMRGYLEYSHRRVAPLMPIADWTALSPAEHEMLAAFRVRFSEFQEQMGKAMRAVAIEEEVDVDRFGSVLAYMEKLGVLDSAEHWKILRELRNSINHLYEDDLVALTEFFAELADATPALLGYYQRLRAVCRDAYGIQ